MTREEKFMQEAILLSGQSIYNNQGGPFGCVIVKGNEIVGRGYNRVTSNNDPTAHAEVEAIRDACKNLNSFQLQDCEIYTSCEPCPMCLGAIYWARPKIVYFANNRQDAADIGFDDSMIYEEMKSPIEERKIPIKNMGREAALKIFEAWKISQTKLNIKQDYFLLVLFLQQYLLQFPPVFGCVSPGQWEYVTDQ
ncbi:MAG: nucleoside deaminase [Niastella sp.]|nr:nucleoside deaminase [Niastella sp.]